MREHGKIVIVKMKIGSAWMFGRRMVRTGAARGVSAVAYVCLGVLIFGFPALARGFQETGAPAASASGGLQRADRLPGNITGTIVDPSGAAVVGAKVTLTRDDGSAAVETTSDKDGAFTFATVPPGAFHVSVTAGGFASQVANGILHAGEFFVMPQMGLAVATEVTQVQVESGAATTAEIAAQQIHEQEKQRVLGVVPNFYVSYVQDAAPLTSKQKFGLAWKTTIDPVNFGVVGVIAGVQQWQNNFSEYGRGAQGYGKRYGAAYADFVSGTFMGGAVLPSILKQDPRYFYKGTGTVKDRVLYALSMAVMCKGDNGKWQFNYSAIGGSLIAGGISNAYYPDKDRGAALVFENTLIGIGENAATNLLQEFVIRKLTPAASKNSASGAGQP
jgi:Carboxypeptidase regulatory-like domain